MAGKNRTQIPRPPSRKRKPSVRPLPPRPKGELERTAVRRLAAMKYRLAGASYRTIAEKLTEDRALEYADAHGISIERAKKKVKHVSTRTAWDDVLAEFEGLRRETEITRGDAMAMENMRIDQLYAKALGVVLEGKCSGRPAGALDHGAPGEAKRSGRADEDRTYGSHRGAPGRHRGDRRQHAERRHPSARAAG